jgi:hypothetical protein
MLSKPAFPYSLHNIITDIYNNINCKTLNNVSIIMAILTFEWLDLPYFYKMKNQFTKSIHWMNKQVKQ